MPFLSKVVNVMSLSARSVSTSFGCSVQTGRDFNALKIFIDASSFLVATKSVDVDLRMAKEVDKKEADKTDNNLVITYLRCVTR